MQIVSTVWYIFFTNNKEPQTILLNLFLETGVLFFSDQQSFVSCNTPKDAVLMSLHFVFKLSLIYNDVTKACRALDVVLGSFETSCISR